MSLFGMDKSINKIISKNLSEEQIEENYQKVYKKYFPHGGYDRLLMDLVVKECRQMALKQLPANLFTQAHLYYIRSAWGIKDIGKE